MLYLVTSTSRQNRRSVFNESCEADGYNRDQVDSHSPDLVYFDVHSMKLIFILGDRLLAVPLVSGARKALPTAWQVATGSII